MVRTPKIKKRAPRCMGTLRQKTERAPRCMGMIFVLLWSSWVPPRAPQAIAPNIHVQVSFCVFCSSGLTCWPLPACTQVEHMQYRIDCIDAFDALIDSMLDHGTFTKNQKTSATLHGNAPAKSGTSAALHGNAFRVFMVQLGASKSSPGDRTKHLFSNDFLLNLVLVRTHFVAAPGEITPGGAPRRGTDGRTDGSFTPGDRTNSSFIFRCRFANSALRDPLGGR